MARDTNRIPELLALVGLYWQKYPDTRLTQMLSSAAVSGGWPPLEPDLFYCEDEVLIAGLKRLLENDIRAPGLKKMPGEEE